MKMRAAVLYEARKPMVVEEVTIDDPQDHEVMVRLVVTGICHSDLLPIKGDVPQSFPVVVGHEGAGIVEKIGPGVTGLQPGDHVIIASVYNCGKCHSCAGGEPSLCLESLNWHLMGGLPGGGKRLHKGSQDLNTMYSQGSFAQYVVVHERQVQKVSADTPLDVACMFSCRLTTGIGAVANRAKIQAGDSVVVYGCGIVGMSVIMGARLCGAGQIIAVDRVEERLRVAREMGATHVINASAENAQVRTIEMTGRGADYAFECIGNPAVMMQAFASIHVTGTCIIVGATPAADMISFFPFEFLYGKRLLGSFFGNLRPGDLLRYIDLYRQGRLPLDKLTAGYYSLDQINEAVDAVDKAKVMRVVVRL
jgi:S-(hydroxymethyl)glutathione dehydrogenase/alcohol dehydrogenase